MERTTPTCGSIVFHGMHLTFISQQESSYYTEICDIYILMLKLFSSVDVLAHFK